MPLKNIIIKLKNLDEDEAKRVKEFVIKKMKEAGSKLEIIETNVNESSQ